MPFPLLCGAAVFPLGSSDSVWSRVSHTCPSAVPCAVYLWKKYITGYEERTAERVLKQKQNFRAGEMAQ